MIVRVSGAALTFLCLLATDAARAQTANLPRFEASVGAQWVGPMDMGAADAVETGNGRPPLTLFRTESTLDTGLGVRGSVGIRVWRSTWAEMSVGYHSPRLGTRVTADIEGAPEVTAEESLQQIQIEAGALLAPVGWRVGSRTQLYASGGGGYLRQLHSGQTLAETGRSYYAGGGAIVWLPTRKGGAFQGVGLRADVRAVAFQQGVVVDDGTHVGPAVALSLTLRF